MTHFTILRKEKPTDSKKHADKFSFLKELNSRFQDIRKYDTAIKLFSASFQGKGKFVPVLFLPEHHAMKAHWETGRIAPRIL
jgi:hypothetical protein